MKNEIITNKSLSIKTNYHIHSNYCDGKNTIEEMVKAAIYEGYDIIGFSGHSYTSFDESYCMSLENTKKYIETITFMKEKYKKNITILCGIEQDYYSDEDISIYDFVIGSVHAIKKNDEYIYVDWDIDTIKNAVEKHYNGDYLSLAEDYYSVVSDVYNKTKCDIIGHFDLLTKFNEMEMIFDESNPRYINAVECALEKLMINDVIFEINTGAMAKKYRTKPYPADFILKKIKEKNGKITINSDCHFSDSLSYGFNESLKLAKDCGFKKLEIIECKNKRNSIEIP